MRDVQLHGGNMADIIQKYSIERERIIDFSANINPWGPPESVMEALDTNRTEVSRYPDLKACELRFALSGYLEVRETNLLLGNGSSELIYLLAAALKPPKALVVSPTFCEYGRAVTSQKGEVEHFFLPEEEDFVFHPKRVLDLPQGGIVFVCNPNNPTGTLTSRDQMTWLADKAAKQGAILVIDEAFMDFVEGKKDFTLVEEAARRDNLIVLGSLGKFFSLAGLRIGYLVATEGMVDKLSRMQCPWNVNSLAQVAAVAALGDREFVSRSISHMKEEREFFFQELEAVQGLRPYPSSANFILVKLVEPGITAAHLADYLAVQGILIRQASSFAGLDQSYFRLAVLDRQPNLTLLNYLKEFIHDRRRSSNG